MEAVILFWVFVGLGTYTWAGYPLLVMLAGAVRGGRRPSSPVPDSELPSVTVLVAVHNGERLLPAKLDNCIALDYPRDRIEIMVVSDGSDDRTDDVVRERATEGVILVITGRRVGKSAAQNLAIPQASGDIVVLTDVETELSTGFAREIASTFADPGVGCATGEVRWRNTGEGANTSAGGLYWRFELWLRRREDAAGMLTQASGQGMAFRKSLFTPMPEHVGDDCDIPLAVLAQGSRCLVAENAAATDIWSPEIRSEFRTRVRMTQRNLTGTLLHWRLLNPVRHPAIAWALTSRAMMRWFTPFFALGALVSNFFLLGHSLYIGILAAELAVLGIAALGILGQLRGKEIPIAGPLGRLLSVNVAFMIGVVRALARQKVVAYRTGVTAANGAGKNTAR